MCFHVEIPDDAGKAFRDSWGKETDRIALEALVMEAYRRANISIGYAAKLLGMGVIECMDWMAGRGVHQPPMTTEEIERDVATVKAFLDKRGREQRAKNVS